jgi:inner membrane protein
MNDDKPSLKKFTQGYAFKVLMLVVLVLLLLIPLNMIRGLVRERGATAAEAEADIMEAWGEQLVEAGPVIAIPGIKTEEVRTKTEKDGEKTETVKTPFTLMISPEKLDINAVFKTEIRRRGIFSVPLFSGTLTLSGNFDPGMALSGLLPDEELFLNQAEFIISLSSQKGIRKINKSEWDSRELFFLPGNRGHGLFETERRGENYGYYTPAGSGMYAALPDFENRRSVFRVSIEIQGGAFIRTLPMGQDTHVSIASDWPSPSFQGSFLPGASTITDVSDVSDAGFQAEWDISYLSRDIPLFWKETRLSPTYSVSSSGDVSREPAGPGRSLTFSDSLFGVNFFRTIDTYALNTRAVKYAILFLLVPFLTLFLLEIFAKRRIHPVPYLLSGIGNAVFYLLLLSLSEQLPFYTAYLIAAVAVILMMTLYSRSQLPSWNKSWYMGLVASVSYVLLYAVLNAESYALLIGSIGTFVVVALVMFLTRRLDWYARGEG